ncbi:MAG: hypothetical protein WBQ14_09430 [Gaiellaceae bacterium]
MAGLVVILGAGASFDCTSSAIGEKNDGLRPPLVKDLFSSTQSFAAILNEYPLAEMAAAEIRVTLANESVALEDYLRTRLRDADDRYARLRYRQVPTYLQQLFYEISRPAEGRQGVAGYTRQPDNYDALLNETLALERVLFVTLNYDTILDQRLGQYEGGLFSLDSYVTAHRNWALFKLHGSVNWGREVYGLPIPTPPPSSIGTNEYLRLLQQVQNLDLGKISFRLGGISDSRYDQRSGSLYYPALSAPLGAEDELSCPADHVSTLKQQLHDLGELNVLVIGYSGLDKEMLRLLPESAHGLKTLLVANGNSGASALAADTFSNLWSLGGFSEDSVFGGTFSELISTGRLHEFVAKLT